MSEIFEAVLYIRTERAAGFLDGTVKLAYRPLVGDCVWHHGKEYTIGSIVHRDATLFAVPTILVTNGGVPLPGAPEAPPTPAPETQPTPASKGKKKG